MKTNRHLFFTLVVALAALALGSLLPFDAVLSQDGTPPTSGDTVASPDGVDAAVSTVFTYQGNLKKSGQAVSANCSFQFSLWDALTGGTQKGTTQIVNNTQVQAGSFTVQLDFGNQFTGDARWLKTEVQCAGDGGYTTLAPRQPLNAVPYALGLLPGATVNTTVLNVPALSVNALAANANAFVAHGNGDGYSVIFAEDESADGGFGLYGKSARGVGVYGVTAVGNPADISTAGVFGRSTGESGTGVIGEALNTYGIGVQGYGETWGLYGKGTAGGLLASGNTFGIRASSELGSGVLGEHGGNSGTEPGLEGWTFSRSANAAAILGIVHSKQAGSSSAGVKGENFGNGANGIGVWGQQSGTGYGVYGYTPNGGFAVVGTSPSPGYAGYFNGRVAVTGLLSKGGGSFIIDHPLDPANKTLSHSFVESPDMMNIYNGNATTDGDGFAIVTLPDWFEALNQDFRYQLTPIGQFAQAIVAEEIQGNQFRIQTDKPGVKVSWQVTGIRHDPFAEANRIVVEEEKSGDEKGHYIYPEVYGKSVREGVWYAASPNFRTAIDNPDALRMDPLPGAEQ